MTPRSGLRGGRGRQGLEGACSRQQLGHGRRPTLWLLSLSLMFSDSRARPGLKQQVVPPG